MQGVKIEGMEAKELLSVLAEQAQQTIEMEQEKFEDELDKLHEELDEKVKTIEHLEQQSEMFEHEKQMLIASLDNVKLELESKDRNLEFLSKSLKEKETVIAKLEENKNESNSIISKLKSAHEALKAEIAYERLQAHEKLQSEQRVHRNKHRTLSMQVDSAKEQIAVRSQNIKQIQEDFAKAVKENEELRKKLQVFERNKRVFNEREHNMKDEISRLLKECEMQNFEMQSLSQIQDQYDQSIRQLSEKNSSENIIHLPDAKEDEIEPALPLQASNSLEAQFRERSHSNVSTHSLESTEMSPRPKSPKVAAPSPTYPSAEQVFISLCAQAVALKYRHLGVYNSELRKLCTICVQNDQWQWYEVYDNLVKYMNTIEETVKGTWDTPKPEVYGQKTNPKKQNSWGFGRMLWGAPPEEE